MCFGMRFHLFVSDNRFLPCMSSCDVPHVCFGFCVCACALGVVVFLLAVCNVLFCVKSSVFFCILFGPCTLIHGFQALCCVL